jgi:hypothetical protein
MRVQRFALALSHRHDWVAPSCERVCGYSVLVLRASAAVAAKPPAWARTKSFPRRAVRPRLLPGERAGNIASMWIALVQHRSAYVALSCVLLSCSGAPPSSAKSAESSASGAASQGAPEAAILPAGLCGFDPYLDEPCRGFASPRFAVVLGERRVADDYRLSATEPLRELEATLAQGKGHGMTVGYPFAVSYDDMLAADSRRGVAVVGALFAELRQAQAYVTAHAQGAEIVALRAGEHGGMWQCEARGESWCEARFSVVQTTVRTAAWSWHDLEQTEELPELPPRCTIEAGRLFATKSDFGWSFIPVLCDSGEEVGVPAQATRVNSVVTDSEGVPRIHRIVIVECDTPTIETRTFGSSDQYVASTSAGCGD